MSRGYLLELERVQDITEADARAEGVRGRVFAIENRETGAVRAIRTATARDVFAEFWDRINGKRAPWSSNPWVWVVDFEREMVNPR